MDKQQIRHTVAFCLKHEAGAPEIEKFLSDANRILTAIPVVKKFEVLRQVSPKNDYHFGFSMEFDDRAAFETYNNHPDHVKFVRERWEVEIAKFIEIDYQAYGG